MTKMFAAAASALALIAGTPVMAAPSDRATTQVEIGDLDLTTARDRDRLNARLDRAIRTMCDTGARDVAAKAFERDCRATALADAAPKKRVAIAAAHSHRQRFALDLRAGDEG